MSGSNDTSGCPPSSLRDLAKNNGCYARIIGKLHPDARIFTVLIHAHVIDNIYGYLEFYKIPKSGRLFGCIDSSNNIVEINRSSIYGDTEENPPPLNKQTSEELLGTWISLDEPIYDTYDIFKKIDDAGWLVLTLPPRFQILHQTAAPYGVYLRQDDDYSYKGPLGYLFITKKQTNPCSKEASEGVSISIKAENEVVEEAREEFGNPFGNLKDYGKNRIKVQAPVKHKNDHENYSIESFHRYKIANVKQIKIEKHNFEGYNSLPFLKDRNYYTPADYIQSPWSIRDKISKSEESFFISQNVLQKIVSNLHHSIQTDIYRFTYLEGQQKNLPDFKKVFHIVGPTSGIFSPAELENPGKTIDWLWPHTKIDPRSTFKLRVWCLFTNHDLLQRMNNFEIYIRTLKYLESECTQIGLIISTAYDKLPSPIIFENGIFEISAFIKKNDSKVAQYFSEDNFYVISSFGL